MNDLDDYGEEVEGDEDLVVGVSKQFLKTEQIEGLDAKDTVLEK